MVRRNRILEYIRSKITPEEVRVEYTGDGCSVPKDITSVQFNDGLQKIGDEAFSNCTSLKSVTLPPTLTEIGNYAFEHCSELMVVTLNDGLQKIGDDTFANCTSLESIELPSTVTDIGSDAFIGCRNLREVIFSDRLQKIGDGAFYNCSSLESITLPSTLVVIGRYAFANCSNLREIILNEGLKKIGVDAFSYCTSLETVALPSTLVDIGAYAFQRCCNLREVIFNNGLQKIGGGTFQDCDTLERFSFPTISYRLENIIQTSHWEELEDKLNEVCGVVQRESDQLFVSIATHRNWNDVRRDLGKITRLVSHYELKEATSTFELALWKCNLYQADAPNTTNRTAYRIDVPGPVKDIMLQYLVYGKDQGSEKSICLLLLDNVTTMLVSSSMDYI